jgi:Putative peptidoglycan binding domain
MRIVLVLICSLALASLALGAKEEKKKEQPKKKGTQAGQVSQPTGKPAGKTATAAKPYTTGKPAGAGKPAKAGKPAHAGKPAETGNVAGMPTAKGKGKGKHAEAGQAAGAGETTAGAKPLGAGKPAKVGKATGAGKPAQAATATTAGKGAAKGKPFKPQKFNLASKSKPATSVAPAVTFQQNRRIQGSQNWQGSNYQVFRNYRSEWHDRDWWRHNHSRIVFVFGGAYYWNSGYWFPAWGYDPGAYYAYDGPIYAYNNLPPDQVIANVQAALQQQGYYHGEVDGLLGPLTREAVANYQRDHGLYTTSTIDRPTLESLGMA